ncbi:MAG: hypothetical protein ABSB00_01075 [Minisyncoccia bacterium]
MTQESRAYIQHIGKVIENDARFKYVMALTLNPRSGNREGVIRCITSRKGKEGVAGQIDRSVLHKVKGKSLEHFEIGEKIRIKLQEKIIKKFSRKNIDFLGLEDPDIWVDEKTNLIHLYFTIPLIAKKKTWIHLGHAFGKDLDNLNMTMPVLMAGRRGGAKEVSIAPLNKKGSRYNLVESSDKIKDTYFSVVRTAIARDMGKPWKFGKIVFHPGRQSARWIAGHASPGPFLPSTFIDIGPGRRVGIMNGCGANKIIGGETKYGTFSIGLFIYDYEKGKIDWVSPKPFIQDSQAGKVRAITFASQFVETNPGKGILYAHVNDSFVRAYTLYAEGIQALLP